MKKIKIFGSKKVKASVFLMVIFTLGFLSINLSLFPNEDPFSNRDSLSKDDFDNLKMAGIYSDIIINDLLTINTTTMGNWTWARTQSWCTQGTGDLGDPYIIDGHTFNYVSGSGEGILIFHSRKYFIIRKCIFKDSYINSAGLHLFNVTNGVISNNDFYNNGAGPYLQNSSKITINGNTIHENIYHGILIHQNSHHNIISGNTIHNNSQYGIYLTDTCTFNTLSGNTVYNQSLSDIYLEESSNNNLVDNTVYDSKANGIFLVLSDNNNIIENTISHNDESGIEFDECNYNIISDNTIFDNLLAGIKIKDTNVGVPWCDHNNITGNTIYHNNESGIDVGDNSFYNDIWDNYIYDNTIHGIFQRNADSAEIYKNWIYNNGETGIYCNPSSTNNQFYENAFVGNTKHAKDYGSGNVWNSSIIGNFWDNHTGPDTSPHDGIVDIQYNITGSAGSIDYLPIAEDGAPRINILSPIKGDAFNETAPDFALTITEDYLASRWYKINNSVTNYIFTDLSGTIEQTGWNALSDGNVTLTFYARDLPGHTGSKEVIVQKDTQAPVITIHSPSSGESFGKTPPSFNITVTDPNLDTIWYTLNGSITILNKTLIWTISQEVWDVLPEGTVTLAIHANDTLGHSSSQGISITKSIPSRGIGLDYFMTGFLITLFSGVVIIVTVIKICHKKQIRLS